MGEDWLTKAESKLGLVFSPSYRWFLNRYKGSDQIEIFLKDNM